VRADDVCDVIFTSGTTGAPKGAADHTQALRQFSDCDIAGLKRQTTAPRRQSIFHMFGYKAGRLASSCRARRSSEAVFGVDDMLQTVAEESVTVLPARRRLPVDPHHPDRGRFDLSSLRVAVTGRGHFHELCAGCASYRSHDRHRLG
jgi:acyl-coenzyme A synthetase/AMP-(fatty) acid ligase